MKFIKTLILSSFVLVFSAFQALAQADQANTVTYTAQKGTDMVIEGTSTIHDWEAEVQQVDATLTFDSAAINNESIKSGNFVKDVTIVVPVEKIEGDRSGMNGKIYDALKKKKHPNITYKLEKAELANAADTGNTFELNTTGSLNIAGVTKTVNFPVKGELLSNGNVKFSGSYSIDMKDYKVDPPSAVFGTIKSGKDVTIKFDLVVGPQQSL